MKFYYRKIASENGYEARLLNADNDVLFHLRVWANEIPAWSMGFSQMMVRDRIRFQTLINSASQLAQCDESTLSLTYFKVMAGLLKSVEHCADGTLAGRKEAISAVRLMLQNNKKINFLAEQDNGQCKYGVMVNGSLLGYDHKVDSELTCIDRDLWIHSIYTPRKGNALVPTGIGLPRPSKKKAFFRLPEETSHALATVLDNFDLLGEIVVQQSNESRPEKAAFTLSSFSNFAKTLVAFLDQSPEFMFMRKPVSFVLLKVRIPELCAFIVGNRHDRFEDRKPYLERIFNSDESPDNKNERLLRLAREIKERDKGNPHTDQPRLKLIIGAISEYYLGQYELDRVARFWRILEKRDWLLRGVLSFYRWPWAYLAVALSFMAISGLGVFANLRPPDSHIHMSVSWLTIGLVVVAALLPALFGLGTLIIRFVRVIRGGGLDYIDLFLPRLLGAIVVGLSVLILQDTSWRIGLAMEWINVALTCFFVYSLSFVYIFVDVHKIHRLSPFPFSDETRTADSIRTTPSRKATRSINATLKVFSLGLLEALLAVLITSVLLFRSAMTEADLSRALGVSPLEFQWSAASLREYPQAGLILQFGALCSFGFFPKLIFLWTGLTLFIGAFAQLIWQDRRITSPL